MLADGIEDLIRAQTAHWYIAFPMTGDFPATGRPELDRSVDPAEVDPSHPRLRWRCRACRNGIDKTNPRHTRIPDQCKWPLVEERIHTCPGCIARRGVAHDAHSFIPGECRFADPEVRGRASGRQGGVHEPRVPASSAPGAGLRDTPRLDDADLLPQEAPDTGGATASTDGLPPVPPPPGPPPNRAIQILTM